MSVPYLPKMDNVTDRSRQNSSHNSISDDTQHDRQKSFPSKIRLYRALFVSTRLYSCEGWTLTAAMMRKIQEFENKCFRRLLHMSWAEHTTNCFVHRQITALARFTRASPRNLATSQPCHMPQLSC